MARGWQFWIDRGGTFTDIVACSADGEFLTRKLLSDNPERYHDAALQGIRDILHGAADRRIAHVKMGTTVGTNALLERNGEPLALLVNRGYRDCLRIGYQNRPDIFALDIRRPEPLYTRVVEIDARMAADGSELRALDRDLALAELQTLYRQGLRAVAIVLMHAWRYPAHERALGELAAAAGFEQISLSHQVSPLPKLIGRGDTCVVDAYLSPVLRRYVEQVERGLADHDPNARLWFMQSNGGLVRAADFQGKDCILSGPAGGMIGAVAVARRAGLSKIIAFDMGGTSTDVAHYAGELERSCDSEIAGARIRVPMMAIHTVAAGGGSILHFDGQRYRVGPDSAGANPGPACYRRGGPLTVTDANLLLGKLPDFPAVFGANGDLPPDRDLVKTLFAELAERIHRESGDRRGPEQVAAGFLSVAIENMAEAIQKISVQKGYHLGEYALCCYGAAGAQHACLLAERLGMPSVLLHPLAGVLSAYGMGLADFRVLKQQALERPWDDIDAAALDREFQALEGLALAELREQSLAEPEPVRERRLTLRYQGTDTALSIDYGPAPAVLADFEQRYRSRFGFCYADRPICIATIEVECIAAAEQASPAAPTNREAGDGNPESVTRIFSRDAWHAAPVYRREQLTAGQTVAGPAIVLEPTSTIVIEAGWQAQLQAGGDLLLRRCPVSADDQPVIARPVDAIHPKPVAEYGPSGLPEINGAGLVNGQDPTKPANAAARPDPVLLAIFNKRFMSVAEQMGFVLQNTAHSVNIKERLDFSCALFDAEANLIANAPHIPVHLGSMGECVLALLHDRAGHFEPDEAFLLNSPYAGGTHLPDITVVTPVFDAAGRELLFFVASRGHHADVGGISPGSMPAHSRDIDDEGVCSAGLKILAGGEFQETAIRKWLSHHRHPARNPEQNLADLRAQIAANRKGAEELAALITGYGLQMVSAYMRHARDHAEACVRALLTTLNDGRFEYELDQGAKIAVAITVDRAARTARIDFSGTSSQLADNFNAPAAVCKAAVLYVFRTLLNDDIPLNAGCLKPLDIAIPAGCLLNPRPPAAVVAGNVETSQYVVDALYGALGVLAGSQGTMNNLTFGNQRYQYYETLCGGAGAGAGFHGADAVHTHMTNSRITDPEVLEQRFPVILREFSIRGGSGGAGACRGGDGAIRRIEFREAMNAAILSSHRRLPPFGLHGGAPGALGVNRLLRADGREQILPGRAEVQVEPGDSLVIETPSGGGFGAA